MAEEIDFGKVIELLVKARVADIDSRDPLKYFRETTLRIPLTHSYASLAAFDKTVDFRQRSFDESLAEHKKRRGKNRKDFQSEIDRQAAEVEELQGVRRFLIAAGHLLGRKEWMKEDAQITSATTAWVHRKLQQAKIAVPA